MFPVPKTGQGRLNCSSYFHTVSGAYNLGPTIQTFSPASTRYIPPHPPPALSRSPESGPVKHVEGFVDFMAVRICFVMLHGPFKNLTLYFMPVSANSKVTLSIFASLLLATDNSPVHRGNMHHSLVNPSDRDR